MLFTLFQVLALVAIPSAKAHMALWHPSVYGFDQPYEPVTPLAGNSLNGWWFHGNANDNPSESMTIIPGQTLTVDIACRKAHSAYGNPTADACPVDSGAYHAGGTTDVQSGWQGNSEDSLMGCALAIAFKPTAAETKPEDFTVMSVQERCVRQRETPFEIPANLPACPEGGCTCAWFWAGKNSALEMYMTGFRCNVQGGVVTSAYPQPVAPRQGAKSGPTQPMYWANTPTNLDYTPTYETKPSYNSAWGWTNGAQTSAFGAGGGGGGAATPARPANNTELAAGGGGNGNRNTNSSSPTLANPSTPSQRPARPGNSNVAAVPSPGQEEEEEEDEAPQGNGNGNWNGNGNGEGKGEGEEPTETTTTRRPRPTSGRWNKGGESSGQEQPSWYNHAAMPAETPAPGAANGQVKPPSKCNAGGRKRRSRMPHGI